ncbi:hypothetical protein [Xanthocytophaga agilis]|uniref:Uncharacterized protein n=1 Tax=Xanthocytophaga agilis TaxID=3048010 RepID=A0AAE3R4A4_9BACT|nr:hypothetical protein [Xanthocytophaga agilis]MDJ1500407.1 hypothetical protein [Xanthocytophaga agilis]
MGFQLKIFLLVLTAWGIGFQGVPKLKKTKLTEQITVSLPEDFHPMTDDEIAAKYFVARKPTASFSSADRVADFSFNQTTTPGRQQDLAMLKDFFKSGIRSNFTKVDFIQEGVVQINERDFVVLEYTAELRDEDPNSANKGVTRQYSYIVYTTIRNKVNVMAFNCPVQVKERWQPIAKEVMNSIKISGK